MKVNKAEREMRSDNPLQTDFDDAEVAEKIGVSEDKLFALRKVIIFPSFDVGHIIHVWQDACANRPTFSPSCCHRICTFTKLFWASCAAVASGYAVCQATMDISAGR